MNNRAIATTSPLALQLLLRVLAVSLAAVLFGACGGSAGDNEAGSSGKESVKPETMVVSGQLKVMSNWASTERVGSCKSNNYNDIKAGAPVTVYDSTGKVVGLGELGPGNNPTGDVYYCTFEFEVSDVPASDSIYAVEVATRGKVNFKKEDAGSISLSLD